MKKILIIFAHPAAARSNINKGLRSAVEDLEGVTVNDLYAHYPDLMIDVQREQAMCEAHDIIVFQHPFYWYSSPAIIKQWFDLVLEHDWAYGSKGDALKNKLALQAITTGGDADTYTPTGINKFTIEQLTSPFKATVNLCKMQCLPPFVISGVHRGLAPEQVHNYAQQYRRAILALRDSKLDAAQLAHSEFFKSDLNKLIRRD